MTIQDLGAIGSSIGSLAVGATPTNVAGRGIDGVTDQARAPTVRISRA